MAAPIILQLENIRHAFGQNEALRGVSFSLKRGEIHALAGDHRAGKSTLARILSGDLKKQHGTISLNDREINSFTTRSAIESGIRTVYQSLNIIPGMSVMENILYGIEAYTAFSRSRRVAIREECRQVFEALEVEVDLQQPVGELDESRAELMQVAKALVSRAPIVILDEVSQILNPDELQPLYRVLRRFSDNGTSFIYITSNIHEIFYVADRVTVLKDGLRSGTELVDEINPSRIVNLAYEGHADGDEPLNISGYDRALIGNLPVGLVLLDTDNRVFLDNWKADALLRDARSSLVGSTLSETLAGVDPSVVQRILDSIEQQSRVSIHDVRLASGRTVQLTASPLRYRRDTATGTTLFVEDVSIDHETKEYLMRAEKVASTAQLAAGVAHEINSPLQSIQSHIEYLRLRDLDDEALDSVVTVQRELDRIVDTVTNLLSFSRTDSNRTTYFDVAHVMDELAMLLNHRLKAKMIQVIRSYDRGEALIHGNENQIKQLLVNLMNNAIDAVLDQGTIELGVRRDDTARFCEIDVRDNGNGIPLEVQSQIFQPFFTTKITKTNAGLGLSICQHIADVHGGLVTFESTPGQGTRFTVRLPV